VSIATVEVLAEVYFRQDTFLHCGFWPPPVSQTITGSSLEGMEDESNQNAADLLAQGKQALRDKLLRAHLGDLSNPSWRVRRKAARGLGELGADGMPAIAELEALLKDKDYRVREAAAEALAKIQNE
jgi:hypothetical protein